MKLKTLLTIITAAVLVVSCNKPAGELVGAGFNGNFKEANPYGMVFVKKGSFMMGSNTQSAVFEQSDNELMVTVDAFWMDETEITNDEYKQFVFWVRDSIALRNAVINGEDIEENYALKADIEDDEERLTTPLNWKMASKIWETYRRDKAAMETDDEAEGLVAAIDPMFFSDGKLNTNLLRYSYSWMNYDQAVLPQNKFDVARGCYPPKAMARVDTAWIGRAEDGEVEGMIYEKTVEHPLREPSDLLTHKIISIYPDTVVWVRDFEYSYNEPMLLQYFNHRGFSEYPVVGVTWEQAHAFCHWRTHYLYSKTNQLTQVYRLPTEAEWEYAARGGRKMAAFPWGSNYARTAEGCFLANFKPYHGALADDTGVKTMRVAQFRPNDFGLFDMAGNVAEWTSSSFTSSNNAYVHDMNPEFQYMARLSDPEVLKRKVVKGGSWKDISAYLQCGARTYEYQFEDRSYLGFRCVRSHIGD